MSRSVVGVVTVACCAAGLLALSPVVNPPVPVSNVEGPAVPEAVEGPAEVQAVAETPTEFDDDEGGNADADDPAILRNEEHPEASLVIATTKDGGMRVFDLDAQLIQAVPPGPGPTPGSQGNKYNNVDLLFDVPFSDGEADVAVVSDRGRDRLRMFRVDPENPVAPLTDVTADDQDRLFNDSEEAVEEQSTAYGLASFEVDGRLLAAVSQNGRTTIDLVELTVGPDDTIGYTEVNTLSLPDTFTLPDGTSFTPCDDPGQLPQVEGMVHDPETGTIFAAQEAIGIWAISDDLTGAPELIDTVREFGQPGVFDAATDECIDGENPGFGGANISRDVEGLTIADNGDGDGFLIASSQGDNTFAAYDRETREFQTSFSVVDGPVIDGSQECDGAMVSTESFGDRFPDGLMVVQDGSDDPEVLDAAGEARDTSNFKFVNFGDVQEAAGLG